MSASAQRKAELKSGAMSWVTVPGARQSSAGIDVSAEPILKGFFSKKELAKELGRNPRTLDRWEVLGVGPPRTHVGRQVLYRRSSVERWLADQEERRGAA